MFPFGYDFKDASLCLVLDVPFRDGRRSGCNRFAVLEGPSDFGIDAPDFVDKFRTDLRTRLSNERGAGTVNADITVGPAGTLTARQVSMAAEELPASWFKQGSSMPVTAIADTRRGFHRPARKGTTAQIGRGSNIGNPLHEYFHHLQRAMPELDTLFATLHRRRTRGEPRIRSE